MVDAYAGSNERPIKAGAKASRWPGTCYHSSNDVKGFYTVTFGEAEIDEIVVTNRSDCCA